VIMSPFEKKSRDSYPLGVDSSTMSLSLTVSQLLSLRLGFSTMINLNLFRVRGVCSGAL
jgi:hypothetical protein